MNRLTAAHTTLPLPSYVRVTNLDNGSSIVVRVNDRGPFHSDRIIDLSAKRGRTARHEGCGRCQMFASTMSAAPRSRAMTTAC